jgi:hypothetical protein
VHEKLVERDTFAGDAAMQHRPVQEECMGLDMLVQRAYLPLSKLVCEILVDALFTQVSSISKHSWGHQYLDRTYAAYRVGTGIHVRAEHVLVAAQLNTPFQFAAGTVLKQ